jgi:hypothetical protein
MTTEQRLARLVNAVRPQPYHYDPRSTACRLDKQKVVIQMATEKKKAA